MAFVKFDDGTTAPEKHCPYGVPSRCFWGDQCACRNQQRALENFAKLFDTKTITSDEGTNT